MRNHSNGYIFALAGNGSYSNRGCEAITRGTAYLLRQKFGNCSFISNYFPSQGSRDIQQEIDPNVLHRPFPRLKPYSLPWIQEQIMRKVFHQPYNVAQVSQVFRQTLQEVDGVLMLGGDNFTLDNSNPKVHFKLNRLALEHKLPVVIWGATVGSFTHNPKFEQWAAKELRQVSLICARETETQKYLASIGVTDNVILAADPAFYLQPSICKLPSEIEEILAEGCIGLNLSPFMHRFLRLSSFEENSLNAWTQVAVEVIHHLVRYSSCPLLLIPHVTSETGNIETDDYLFLRKIAQIIEEPERVFVLGPDLNAEQTKWVISQVRVFAGARTHSTLAAISSGVPTVCIGYSMKAKGITKDVYGHLEWLIKGQDLVKDPAIFYNRLMSLCTQEDELRAHLVQVNSIFQQRARDAVDRLAELIG